MGEARSERTSRERGAVSEIGVYRRSLEKSSLVLHTQSSLVPNPIKGGIENKVVTYPEKIREGK